MPVLVTDTQTCGASIGTHIDSYDTLFLDICMLLAAFSYMQHLHAAEMYMLGAVNSQSSDKRSVPIKDSQTQMTCVLQAIASIAVEQECVSPDKAWCEQSCADVPYATSDPEWQPCLVECSKNSQAEVDAFASALARIDVNTEISCVNDVDPVGSVYVTVQNLLVRPLALWCGLPVMTRAW